MRLPLRALCVAAVAVVAAATAETTLPPEWAPRVKGAHMLWAPTDVGLASNKYPVMANGFLGTTINSTSLYVSGVFNGYLSHDPSHRARLQSPVNVHVLGASAGPAALDMEWATYLRRSAVSPVVNCTAASVAATGASCTPVTSGTVWVEQRWYAHRQRSSVMVTDVRVWAAPGSVLPAGGQPLAVLALANNAGSPSSDVNLTSHVVPAGAAYTIVNGSTLVAETNTSALTGVCMVSATVPSVLPVAANNSVTAFVAAVRTTLETVAGDIIPTTLSDYDDAVSAAAAGTLWPSHVAEWAATLWSSGVELTGSDGGAGPGNALYLAQAVNMSLFSILSSIREDRPYSISPGGLSPGYNGHTFWDCETWMFPPVMMLHPGLATSLLEYRYQRIDTAKLKAKSYVGANYTGTMFPWESAFTGAECCPTSAPTGLREIHISGDIAFAVSQYLYVTGDITWLSSRGQDLLAGIANFWVSKARPGPTPGSLVIDNVIPPDEYEDHVNNSAYTNSVAKLALMAAVNADRTLGMPPAKYQHWERAAKAIVVPFNATAQFHPEFDSYHGQTIKQADVILMGFPLEVPFANMTPTVRRNDLLYYGNHTDANGPAMTWAMQSVGLLELGDHAGAASNFNRSFANQGQPFLVWTETPTGGTPNFVTGAGGFLQAVLFGYPGMRLRADCLFVQPQLFENVGAVKLRGIGYLGNRLTIAYDAKSVTFEVAAGGTVVVGGHTHAAHGLQVADVSSGKVVPLAAGKPVTLALTGSGFQVQPAAGHPMVNTPF